MWTRVAAAVATLALCHGCASVGGDPTTQTNWDRVRDAAGDATRSPMTWVPLAAAALLQIDDWDKQIAQWAVNKTPIFGSRQDARDRSSDLRDLAALAAVATTLASPETSSSWVKGKAGRSVALVGSLWATVVTTSAMKKAVGRTRPDNRDDRSFPSGHASSAAASATFASRTLENFDMQPIPRRVLRSGVSLLAAGAAWARVEGEEHYPADVLVGAALGYFFSAVINDAFLSPSDSNVDVSVAFAADHATVGLRVWF